MDPYIAKVIKLLDKNKTVAAFVAPMVAGLVLCVGNWIVTGDFNTNELRLAVGGAFAGLASAIGTYATPAGNALVDAVPTDEATVVREPMGIDRPI